MAPIAPHPLASPSGGLLSYILASESVSPVAQASLDRQRDCLIKLMGVANAYARRQTQEKANPELIYDLALWQGIFSNLPLMGPPQFGAQTFSQGSEDMEIDSKFIEVILGFAVEGGPVLAEFGTFLSGISDSIRLGVAGEKSYKCAIIGGVLRTQDAQPDKVEAYLQGYWIDFSSSQENMRLDHKYVKSLFDVGALDNVAVKQQFYSFLEEAQAADVRQSKNFFEGSFPPAMVPRRLAS